LQTKHFILYKKTKLRNKKNLNIASLNDLFLIASKNASLDHSFLQVVYSGDESSLLSFLKKEPAPKELNQAIEYAVFEKKLNILKILLGYKAAADINLIEKQIQNMPWFDQNTLSNRINSFTSFVFFQRPAHDAAKKGDLNKLRTFTKEQLEKEDSGIGSSGIKPIHAAALGGRLEAIKYLIEQGVDLKTKDSKGHSVLHFAIISTNRSTELIRYLVEKSSELINDQNCFGETPMHFAATQKDYGIIKYLMQQPGADSLKTDTKGVSPLALLWKIIGQRDPLNIISNPLLPSAIFFITRLLLINYIFAEAGPLRFGDQKEEMMHSALAYIDSTTTHSITISFFINFFLNNLGFEGQGSKTYQKNSLSTYETALASLPGFKSIKACFENRQSRDIKKITANVIINVMGTLHAISSVYRYAIQYHEKESANAKANPLIKHMLNTDQIKEICSSEHPYKKLKRLFREWSRGFHPDRNSNTLGVFQSVSSEMTQFRDMPSNKRDAATTEIICRLV